MNAEMIRKAQDYVAAQKDQLIQDAIAYCMFTDDDLVTESILTRYERMLSTMVQAENDKAAAAAYMMIALYNQSESVFTKAKGIRWMLLADAFDAYEKLLQEELKDIVPDDVYEQYKMEVALLAWEVSHGMITFEE